MKTTSKTTKTTRPAGAASRDREIRAIKRVPLDDGWNDLAPVSRRLAQASPTAKGGDTRRIVSRPATTRLYLAYGSNLNVAQMQWRCPKARKLGTTLIPNTRLIFRGVADIEPCKGRAVPVGVWAVTPTCEAALDAYEGFRRGNGGLDGLYRREYLPVSFNGPGGETMTGDALVYVMNRGHYGMPSRGYLGTIIQGYKDFGLDASALQTALEDTWDMDEGRAA